jgi:hypothetical protein
MPLTLGVTKASRMTLVYIYRKIYPPWGGYKPMAFGGEYMKRGREKSGKCLRKRKKSENGRKKEKKLKRERKEERGKKKRENRK